MTDEFMAHVYFYGFWAAGIICCLCAIFAVFVVGRAILIASRDGDEPRRR